MKTLLSIFQDMNWNRANPEHPGHPAQVRALERIMATIDAEGATLYTGETAWVLLVIVHRLAPLLMAKQCEAFIKAEKVPTVGEGTNLFADANQMINNIATSTGRVPVLATLASVAANRCGVTPEHVEAAMKQRPANVMDEAGGVH